MKYSTRSLIFVNKENKKFLAYLSFYIYFKTGEEKYWFIWRNYHSEIHPTRIILKYQRKFLKNLDDPKYLSKHVIPVDKDMKILRNEISLVYALINKIPKLELNLVGRN